MSNDPYNPGNDPYAQPASWQQQPQSPYGQPPQYPPTPPYDPAQPYGAGQQYPGQSYDPHQQQYPPTQPYDPAQPQYAPGGPQWQQPGQQYPPAPGPYGQPQPGYPPSPYGSVPQQPPSSGRGLKIALLIIGIVVVLCGGVTAIILVANHKSNSEAGSGSTPTAATTTGGGSTSGTGSDPTGAPESDAAGVKTFAMGDTATGTAYDGSTFTMKLSNAVVKGNDIMVTVDITCTKGSVAYNPLYYSIKGKSGKEYDIDFLGDGTLDAGDLAQGKSVNGTLAFEAPSSELHGGKVAVTDAVFAVQAYWSLG